MSFPNILLWACQFIHNMLLSQSLLYKRHKVETWILGAFSSLWNTLLKVATQIRKDNTVFFHTLVWVREITENKVFFLFCGTQCISDSKMRSYAWCAQWEFRKQMCNCCFRFKASTAWTFKCWILNLWWIHICWSAIHQKRGSCRIGSWIIYCPSTDQRRQMKRA